MQTFRRLNDPERYYGLSWRGWVLLALGGLLLYLAVRFSPFPTRPTISITVIVLSAGGTLLHAVSGQALGPARFLLALIRHTARRKTLAAPDRPDKHGVVLADPAPVLEDSLSARLEQPLTEAFS